MKGAIQIQTYIFTIEGIQTYVKVPASFNQKQAKDLMENCRMLLLRFPYTEYTIIDNFMFILADYLENKKMMKFGTKKMFKQCRDSLKNCICHLENRHNGEYYNEYSQIMYDRIKPHIFKLRDLIATKFNNLGCGEKSGLYATLAVAYNMFGAAEDSYVNVMDEIERVSRIRMHDAYRMMKPDAAVEYFKHLFNSVLGEKGKELHDEHIVKDKSINAEFSKIYDAIYDPSTIVEVRKEALEILPKEVIENIKKQNGGAVYRAYLNGEQ